MTEIEILSLYLPHNVELFSTTTGKIYKLCANTYNHGSEEVSISSALESGHFKLRLYPLSMLTEEIEHEGERFVPLEKLFSELYPWYPFMEFKKDDVYYDPDFIVWDGHGISSDYKRMTFDTIQFLARHHVDFMGLIDQGKAIDKSKL